MPVKNFSLMRYGVRIQAYERSLGKDASFGVGLVRHLRSFLVLIRGARLHSVNYIIVARNDTDRRWNDQCNEVMSEVDGTHIRRRERICLSQRPESVAGVQPSRPPSLLANRVTATAAESRCQNCAAQG